MASSTRQPERTLLLPRFVYAVQLVQPQPVPEPGTLFLVGGACHARGSAITYVTDADNALGRLVELGWHRP